MKSWATKSAFRLYSCWCAGAGIVWRRVSEARGTLSAQQRRAPLGHPVLLYAPVCRSVMAGALLLRPSDPTDDSQGLMHERSPVEKDPCPWPVIQGIPTLLGLGASQVPFEARYPARSDFLGSLYMGLLGMGGMQSRVQTQRAGRV